MDSADRAAAGIVSPSPQTKTTNAVTVTIVDGKTGAKREVVVAAPARPATAPDEAQLGQNSLETTGPAPSPLQNPATSQTAQAAARHCARRNKKA